MSRIMGFPLVIPHRDDRPFVHAADIVSAGMDYLQGASPGAPLFPISCRFQAPLGSVVRARITEDDGDDYDTPAVFQFQGPEGRQALKLTNRNEKLELRDSYRFDEKAAARHMVVLDGEVHFSGRGEADPISILLASVKHAVPNWPADPINVQIVKILLSSPIKGESLAEYRLKVNTRASFIVSEIWHSSELIGEVRHVLRV